MICSQYIPPERDEAIDRDDLEVNHRLEKMIKALPGCWKEPPLEVDFNRVPKPVAAPLPMTSDPPREPGTSPLMVIPPW